MKVTVVTLKVLFWITAFSVILTVLLSFVFDHCGGWFLQWGASIAIGVFASSLVVLISEFVRYKHSKSDIESDLYYNLSLLYLKLKTVLSEIEKSYKEPLPQLTKAFLHPQTIEINNSNEKVKYDILQYYTIHKNEVYKAAKAFMIQTIPQLTSIVFALRAIEIAIIEDVLEVKGSNLDSLKQYNSGQTNSYNERPLYITAKTTHVNMALQEVVSELNDELFDAIETFLIAISNSKSNNFDWKKDKDRVLQLVKYK